MLDQVAALLTNTQHLQVVPVTKHSFHEIAKQLTKTKKKRTKKTKKKRSIVTQMIALSCQSYITHLTST